MLIKTDLRTTHVMAPLPRSQTQGRYPVARALVEQLQDYDPGWRVWGDRIDTLSPLWPYCHLRTELLKGARLYVSSLEKRGWVLLSAEADMLVWGPIVGPVADWRRAGARVGTAGGRQLVPTPGGSRYHVADDQGDTYWFVLDGHWLASTHLVETPQVQAQHRPPVAQRDAINRRLFPGRQVSATGPQALRAHRSPL